ncbi:MULTISPECIES: hypothetical protein [Thiorhodovibrio]|uniref:hypothetical protein n=1 Tax=Thiorhodovibrio TaxID=61593 RepID=UPI001911CA85|nr:MULTISPECIES: hypothetical protein [Thiorhodovibrio]MBK5967980.1 hypothetical protein [Thiorhodovibrio winogradskyi]WPL11795.1 hypothetical protein Thiosp_01547 [Thiorhodovibrio litoralis]
MKIAAPIAIVLALVGWGLTFFIGDTLLSGTALEDRMCQTGCIKGLFFSGFGVGAVALVLSGLTLSKRAAGPILSVGALLLALPLFAIYAGIVVIGTLAA